MEQQTPLIDVGETFRIVDSDGELVAIATVHTLEGDNAVGTLDRNLGTRTFRVLRTAIQQVEQGWQFTYDG